MSPSRIRCPICRRPVDWDSNPNRPFCSERCRVQDLGNWAAERYRIPEPEPAEQHEERPGDEGDEV